MRERTGHPNSYVEVKRVIPIAASWDRLRELLFFRGVFRGGFTVGSNPTEINVLLL